MSSAISRCAARRAASTKSRKSCRCRGRGGWRRGRRPPSRCRRGSPDRAVRRRACCSAPCGWSCRSGSRAGCRRRRTPSPRSRRVGGPRCRNVPDVHDPSSWRTAPSDRGRTVPGPVPRPLPLDAQRAVRPDVVRLAIGAIATRSATRPSVARLHRVAGSVPASRRAAAASSNTAGRPRRGPRPGAARSSSRAPSSSISSTSMPAGILMPASCSQVPHRRARRRRATSTRPSRRPRRGRTSGRAPGSPAPSSRRTMHPDGDVSTDAAASMTSSHLLDGRRGEQDNSLAVEHLHRPEVVRLLRATARGSDPTEGGLPRRRPPRAGLPRPRRARCAGPFARVVAGRPVLAVEVSVSAVPGCQPRARPTRTDCAAVWVDPGKQQRYGRSPSKSLASTDALTP